MADLITRTASFYKLCSILTPMEKLADATNVPNVNSGDSKKTESAGAAVKQLAQNNQPGAPDVVLLNPPTPDVTVTRKGQDS